jgi:ferrochelatase
MKHAVFLVNLGTPDAPTPKQVKKFLAEFLGDRRVIQTSPFIWHPLLHGIVLPLRAKRVAKLYQSIWTDEGSPIKVYTARQAKALQQALGEQASVYYAMRYRHPSIDEVLKQIIAEGFDKITVLPLYPQFSHTTTSSIIDAVEKVRNKPEINIVPAYYNHPLYIQALCNSIQEHWKNVGRGERLLFSFHGLPEKYVAQGDPYPEHCRATAQAVAARLGLSEDQYHIAYQSRFGPTVWVGPYTDTVLSEWAAQGIKHVDIISPAFAADCLETLEELSITNKEAFLAAGGERLHYIPALNDRDDHIQMMVQLVNNSKI